MGSYLKSYRVIIRTLAPIFIGSDKKIDKKMYIYDRNSNCVFVPYSYKMFEGLRKLNLLSEYEMFMLTDRNQYRGDLQKFLFDNRVNVKEYNKWIEYKLNLDDLDLSKNSLKEISTFVKDAYGCPYVPGSSLKGAVRTALLSGMIFNNREKLRLEAASIKSEDCKSRTYYLARPMKAIENTFFNTLKRRDNKPDDILNDCFTGLRVSDSRPLDTKCLTLCQKVDIATDGTRNKLNIMRECIRPGTIIEFEIEIDTQFFPFSLEEVLACMQFEYEQYCNDYLAKFPALPDMEKMKGSKRFFLGGGCGFHTKTIISALYQKKEVVGVTSKIINNTLSQKTRIRHKHDLDASKYRISPHMRKCTLYHGKLYDMGLCSIDFQPIG